MKPSIRNKLEHLSDRYQEITALLADREVQADANRFRDLSREYAQVEPVSQCYRRYVEAEQELHNAEEMLSDPEMAELAEEAKAEASQTLAEIEPELKQLPTTNATSISRFVRAPAARRPPCLPATCCVCTCVMQSRRAGAPRW